MDNHTNRIWGGIRQPSQVRSQQPNVGAEEHGGRCTVDQLWDAIAEDDHLKVRESLECLADVNCRNERGETVLSWAVTRNHVETVSVLLSRGADARIADLRGDTPLHHAIDDMNIIKILIDKGANVNAQNNDGHTPLHFAIQRCYASDAFEAMAFDHFVEGLEYELNERFRIERLDVSDEFIRNTVREFGYIEVRKHYPMSRVYAKRQVVALLIEKGSDPEILDRSGKSAASVYGNSIPDWLTKIISGRDAQSHPFE